MNVTHITNILLPSNASSKDGTFLPGLAAATRDPELRARLADVAWLILRNHAMASLAIDSYIESARRLDRDGAWPDAKDRVERALRLSTQLGKAGKEKFATVVEFIEEVMGGVDATGERRLQPLLFMELLIEFRTGDMDRWSALTETLAEQCESEQIWHQAEGYWETKAKWDRLRNDDESRLAAQVRAAETYLNLARESLQHDPPEYMVAAHHLQKAIEGMRQAGKSSRAESLHRELLKYQELALGQMQRIEHKMDISSYVADAIEAVRGKTLDSALLTLATMQNPTSVAYLREQSERSGKQFVVSHLFPTFQLDHAGRKAAIRPSLHSDDPKVVEAAIQAEMFDFARQCQQGCVAMFIEPARGQIVLDHHVAQRDLRSIVSNNPYIAEGRAELILRGLHAGLIGDFTVACHLLVPQIEHSIRHILNQLGVITTGLSSEGIQEEHDLSRLLQRSEASEVWGEDLVFDLRGLLVERFGSNLRNRMAHGLVHEREFDMWQGPYLWWIALRFYLLPILAQLWSEKPPEPETEDSRPEQEKGEESA